MSSPGSLQDVRVLLVEDDFHAGVAVGRLLRDLGAEVTTAGSVKEALEALKKRPQIVILDVHLPDGSGLEIARAATLLHPMPHVIAASGYAGPVESFQLGRLKVQHYLSKPFSVNELMSALSDMSSPIDELMTASARVVGELGLIEARDVVRDTMVTVALSQAEGNRSQAAKVLGVTRQAVQSAMRDEA